VDSQGAEEGEGGGLSREFAKLKPKTMCANGRQKSLMMTCHGER